LKRAVRLIEGEKEGGSNSNRTRSKFGERPGTGDVANGKKPGGERGEVSG